MTTHHLAQFNVGTLKFPYEDPAMAEFTALLDPINALADGTPGFVWRLIEDGRSDATGIRPMGADVIINFSVWEALEPLWDFVYRSAHLDVLRRRREWFQRHVESHMVLWWIPSGHIPTVTEAVERLELLRAEGPTPRAFTFNTPYTPEAEGTQVHHA
jgi:hypothetical protein